MIKKLKNVHVNWRAARLVYRTKSKGKLANNRTKKESRRAQTSRKKHENHEKIGNPRRQSGEYQYSMVENICEKCTLSLEWKNEEVTKGSGEILTTHRLSVDLQTWEVCGTLVPDCRRSSVRLAAAVASSWHAVVLPRAAAERTALLTLPDHECRHPIPSPLCTHNNVAKAVNGCTSPERTGYKLQVYDKLRKGTTVRA